MEVGTKQGMLDKADFARIANWLSYYRNNLNRYKKKKPEQASAIDRRIQQVESDIRKIKHIAMVEEKNEEEF